MVARRLDGILKAQAHAIFACADPVERDFKKASQDNRRRRFHKGLNSRERDFKRASQMNGVIRCRMQRI
jgi:hypothetical protein